MYILRQLRESNRDWILDDTKELSVIMAGWQAQVSSHQLELHSETFRVEVTCCLLKSWGGGAPGWFSWLSIQLLISAQVMIPGLWDQAPVLDSVQVWSLLKILPLSLPPSLCLSLSFCPSPPKMKKVGEVEKIDETIIGAE